MSQPRLHRRPLPCRCLEAGALALAQSGVKAMAFPCDLSDPQAVAALIADVKHHLGPIAILHWNAYAAVQGDVTTFTPDELRTAFDVGVTGPIVAIQKALGDLKEHRGAVLITGGGFAFYDEGVDAMIAQYRATALGVVKAAQHKLVGVLAKQLPSEGVYVGEVVVTGLVKGTAFDSGQATIEPDAVAERFFQLAQERQQSSVILG